MVLKFFHELIWLRALSIVAALVMGSSASAYGAERALTGLEDTAEYALPDGTLPVICFGNGADSNSTPEHFCGDCCLTTNSFPKPSLQSYQVLRLENPVQQFALITLHQTVSPRLENSPPRGPPTA